MFKPKRCMRDLIDVSKQSCRALLCIYKVRFVNFSQKPNNFDKHRNSIYSTASALSQRIMADTRKHVLIAGLGRFVPADYEAGAKLGVQKTNKQMVLDVRLPLV